MKQFINKYKWLALILLVLPGCQRDDGAPFEEPVMESRMVVSAEDIPEVKATLLKKMQSGDNAKLFSANMGAENNLAIDWQRVMQLIDSTGQKTYTFAIADEDDDPFSFYNLVMKYSALGDAHEPFLMKYTMSEGFIPEYLSTGSLENFQGTVKKIRISQNSGTTSSYNSKAPSDSRGVASGEDDSCPGTTVGSGSNNGGGDTPPDANNPPDSGGVSCETYIVTNTWYSQACGGGTCEEPIVTGRNSSVVTICNREGDTGEAAGGGEDDCDPDEGEIPILKPDQILLDSSFVGTKAECVYEKLNSLSESFKDMIKKFDGEFPVAHLKFAIDNTLTTENAVTDNGGQYIIEIRLNGNTLEGRTVLGLARTFAHEIIHAELFRKVRSVGGSVSINDFPGIYDYYRRHVKVWQHEQMAGHYRETIVNILRQFDNQGNTNEFYDLLAWSGLQGTTAYNALSDDKKADIQGTHFTQVATGERNCD